MEKNTGVSEISLRDYIDLLRRRKTIVIQTFVVIFVIGAIAVFIAKPQYRTSARILVEGKPLVLTQYSASDPMTDLFTAEAGHDVSTQLEMLQGAEILHKAYLELGVPPGSVSLEVKQVSSTDIIELVIVSNSAAYATQFGKTLPGAYIRYITGARRAGLDNALDFARQRLAEENTKLKASEQNLAALREKNRIYSSDLARKARLDEKDAAEKELQLLTSQIAGEQSRLNVLMIERSRLPEFLETPTITANSQVDVLNEKLADLQNERAILLLKYNLVHPAVKQQDELIADVQRRLEKLTRKQITSVRTRNPAVAEADRVISAMKSSVAGTQSLLVKARERNQSAVSELTRYVSHEPQQEQLEAAVVKFRESVALLTKDADNLDMHKKGLRDPVTVVTPAPDAAEVMPRSAKNLIYPALVGLILGFCFALVQEFLDDKINSPEDARRLLQTPTLGYVPLVGAPDMRLLSKICQAGTHTTGCSLLESYRVLRSNVQFASVDKPITSLLITSTTPGEGKSVTASNLAVAFALDGRRVILVDADLRRPTLHEKFAMPSHPGLTHVLVGQTLLEEALQDAEIPGLRLLMAGPLPPNPAELLNSQAMQRIHLDLKSMADVVIYDSPPVLATADAQVLSATVDGVLYVIQFGEAKKSTVRHAMELLGQARAHLLGVVFNKIDLTTKRDEYYYGYYTHYQYYKSEQVPGQQKGKRRTTEEFEALLSKTNGNGHGNGSTSADAGPPTLQR